jgi:predicted membrane protein
MPFESEDELAGFANPRKRNRRVRSAAYQLTVAVALIAFGILLFLDNVGFLPVERLYEYWPVIPIALGVSRLIYRPSVVSALWSVFLICVGSVFLLINLHVLHIRNDGTGPLALLFITFGFLALIKTIDKRTIAARQRQFPGFVHWTSTDILNESTVMGSVKRRVESTNFLGGEIHTVLGNIEIDLRAAQLPTGARSATIEVECILGATTIRVPESWKVGVQAQGIMGNVEDKTIPPRADKAESAPVLIVTGSCVMGQVELEN